MRVRRSIGAYTWRTWGRELARDELFDSVSLMVVGNDGGGGERLWRRKWSVR